MSASTPSDGAALAAAAASPAPTPASASASASAASDSAASDVLVQYVVMRGDLIKQHKWNVGGLIANGSHACVAVLFEHAADPDVQSYVSPSAVGQMHKVVLSARDEAELTHTSDVLTSHSIAHKLWVEQPENMRVCLAIKPYRRSIIQPLLKHLKLFR